MQLVSASLGNSDDHGILSIPQIEDYERSLCEKTQTVFFYALAMLSVGAALGSVCGVALGGIPGAIIGAVVGGAVGLIAGLVYGILFGLQPAEIRYREALLDQLETRKGDLAETINLVKQVVTQKSFYCSAGYQNHAFHHNLTILTDAFREDPELSMIWTVFLNSLDGFVAYYPDGTSVELDFSVEKNRLQSELLQYSVEKITPQSEHFEEDMLELFDLERECFGERERHNIDYYRRLLSSPENGFYVARDSTSNEILGFVSYRKETAHGQSRLHICSVGRKAAAARLGIGEKIFRQIFQDCPRNLPAILEVREGNRAAIELYKKMGFIEQPRYRREGYYQYPTEAALLMYLPLENRERIFNALQEQAVV
jgi:ribosomal protein S18 acetylase RimI-like enzyme